MYQGGHADVKTVIDLVLGSVLMSLRSTARAVMCCSLASLRPLAMLCVVPHGRKEMSWDRQSFGRGPALTCICGVCWSIEGVTVPGS
jgi:hypothetical protein